MISATLAAVTGTGAVATGLSAVDSGGVSATVINSATSATTDLASVTSISGGSVSVAVTLLTFTGPTIAQESGAKNVAVIATGYVN